MTPEATKSAASFPRSAATRSWRRLMVGSSTYTSSPTSASAMARRMPAEGRVTVSLRRSMGASLVDTATLLLTRTTGLADLRRGRACLLYTSDAADDLLCVDLGGRRIIKKK